MNEAYQNMIETLRRQHGLLLVGHEDPDCDCLASMLGLYFGFHGAEKGWRMLRRDAVPANCDYLPGLDRMLDPEQLDIEPQAVLLIDCGEVSRTGDWLAPLLAAKPLPLYCIDHHMSNSFTGSPALIEPQAAAAAEIVTALLNAAGEPIGPDAALALYSGMVADTGCFRFNNTNARCLQLAAQLLPQVDLELVRIRQFENRSYANLKMLSAVLRDLTTACDGRLCWSWISREEQRRYGAGYNDCHNLVNELLALSGVKVGIVFEEYDGFVKLSLRCRSGYRVDELARQFGGGGHCLASGCKIEGDLAAAIPPVIAAARKLFE